MKSIRTLTLSVVVILSVAVGIAGCAGVFDKCVKPEITAATKLAPADLAKEVAAFLTCGIADLPDLAAPCAVAGLADLALALGPGGADAVNCIVSYYENNGTGLLQSRAKAVGAKRGVTPELYGTHACNGVAPGLRGVRDAEAAFLHGRSIADLSSIELTEFFGLLQIESGFVVHELSLSTCDRACGAPLTSIATSSGCSCWRASKANWRESRWVALAR